MKSGVVTLRSLELAGFKSFAKRTKLEFGEGLVAIVGPNGSGKSNVVDAIKWVFGEQKNKSLRTDRAEELIYHGGDGKSRASMAEVIITLDNTSGKIPVELPEIEITRRLYRSGESNYLLNGKKVSLSSITELLAKSGFGIGSYTVVGQGLIEKLILATGQQRKQLFEEASGIKQYEIKQSQTKSRLESTNQNLTQINSMITELKPQQAVLAQQANMLSKQKKLVQELRQLRQSYLSQTIEECNKVEAFAQSNLKEHRNVLHKLNVELSKLEKERRESNNSVNNTSVDELTSKLLQLEKQRDEIESKITQATVGLEQRNLQQLADDESKKRVLSQIEAAKSNLNHHHKQQKSIQKLITKYEDKISIIDDKVQAQTKLLNKTRADLTKTQKTEYLQHSLGLIDVLQTSIEAGKALDQLAIIFYKLRRMIRHSIVDNAAELALKVGRIQNSISALLDEREKLTESQTNEVIRLRASELDESSITTSLKNLQSQIKSLEINNNKSRKKESSNSSEQLKRLEDQKTTLLKSISETQHLLAELAGQSNTSTEEKYFVAHEALTNKIILVKQKISNTEAEIANNKEKIISTEELKRNWYGNEPFRPIKKPKITSIDKIRSIEAELNLLKDIDPEIEKDHTELAKRMEFLNNQSKDLQRALKNLEAVFNKTEQELQKNFQEGFSRINKNFGKSFKELFGGGEASLQLIDEDDGYGIEIIVQLPNKRAQNLSSLSGGEKALASTALLAGILASNPSPFVVLDEVDAALDESNTQKFAKLLTTITEHSQVLVVTHNHDTMAVADELLGVTTAGNNESHIIRVKLDSIPMVETQ